MVIIIPATKFPDIHNKGSKSKIDSVLYLR